MISNRTATIFMIICAILIVLAPIVGRHVQARAEAEDDL